MKHKFLRQLHWALGLLLFFTAACEGTPLEPAKQLLYVLDNLNDAIYVLEGIDTITGPQDPARTISGDKTLLDSPTAVAVDGLRDILYVTDANQGAVLVFAPASILDGDVDPDWTLPAGANVQAMTFDAENNRLYVSDIGARQILVWDQVSTTENGQVPDRTFNLNFLASGIFIDNIRDFLYTGDPIGMVVQVFEQASTLIGTPPIARAIADADRDFNRINSITMNRDNDILFVADSNNPSVEIFSNASTLDGDVVPDRSLMGDATNLSDDTRYSFFLNNTLYVSVDDRRIGVWNDANQVDGDTAPDRLITVNPAARIVGFGIDLLH